MCKANLCDLAKKEKKRKRCCSY